MFALLEGELKWLRDIALDENLEDFVCIQSLEPLATFMCALQCEMAWLGD